MSFAVRPAVPTDAAAIHGLIEALAVYEKLQDRMVATEADTAAALFGDGGHVFADVAEADGKVVGMSVWFLEYSTFLGRAGIYLEDLFVLPEYRGRGIATDLMRALARRCAERGYGRLKWQVLDWNAPAIAAYERMGAAIDTTWHTCVLDRAGIAAMAGA